MNKRPLIIITDKDGREDLLRDIINARGSKIYAIVLRSVSDVKAISEKLRPVCQEHGVLLLAHSNSANIQFCDGIHLNAKSIGIKEVRSKFGHEIIIGYSSHSVPEAKQALRDGANYVFLSPVFKSKDSQSTPLGVDAFNKAVEQIGSGVFALGGVNENNFKLLNNQTSGYASMSDVFN